MGRIFHGGEALLGVDGDFGFAQEVLENGEGDFGFKGPHGGVGAVEGTGAGLAAAAFAKVFGRGLKGPRGGLGVVLGDAVVELAGEAADGGFVADVGRPEAAGGEAAEVFAGFGEDDSLPMRLAWTAAAMPAELPPKTQRSVSITAARRV